MKRLFDLFKNIIVIGCGIFTLLTVFLYAYTSFYARPTGDDLGYSYTTHRAWEETHSVISTMQAAIEQVVYQRDVCASDYTMVFLVSLMPEVFSPWTFWIACWFILCCLTISIILFSKEILINRFNMPRWFAFFLGCMGILLILQEMPSTNSGMYWYSGAVHYPFAFSLALFFITLSSKYLYNGKKISLILLCFLAIVIGGDGYFATVFLVSSFFFLLIYGVIKGQKRVFALLIPFVVLLSCCIFCITGEGPSKVRTGGQLDFSVSLAGKTIFDSVIKSLRCGFSWISGKFFVFPCAFGVMYILLRGVEWENVKFDFKRPGLVVSCFFLIYASVYAPWVYSEFFDEFGASMGPENYCFYTFVLFLLFSLVYVLGYFRKKYVDKSFGMVGNVVTIALLAICLFCSYRNRHALKETHGYVGMEYILSNSAEDYKEQCKENMEMLLDPTIQNIELIPTNSYQGLLCNMVATEDPDFFTSWVYSEFYGKESVVMITE